MASIVTERYNQKDFFKNINENYDCITTKSLSRLLYLSPGNYRFLVSDRIECYGIRYLTYNSGKKKILPLIEGTLFMRDFKTSTFEINNHVHCNLMIIPANFVLTMQSNSSYILHINELGEVVKIRRESEQDFDIEEQEFIF